MPRVELRGDRVLLRELRADDGEPLRSYQFAIEHHNEDVGMMRLDIDEEQGVQLRYELRHDLWGEGIAPEAASLAVGFVFERLGLQRVWASAASQNERSRRVMEKLGMRREGLVLRHFLVEGEWRDSLLYAITKDEWQVFQAFAATARNETQLELTIGRASADEIVRVHELMRVVGQDMIERYGMDHWRDPFPLAQMQFDARRRETYVIRTKDEGVIGSFTIGLEPMWPSEVEIPFTEAVRPLYLHRLMVHPKYQSASIGALMMRTAETLGRARGCDTLRLETRSDFAEVRRFYERNGFVERFVDPNDPWCALDKAL